MPTYQPNIPTGTVPLSEDYLNLKGNFQQLDIVFNVDHVPFSDVTAQFGYHKSIHFNPISTTAPPNDPNNVPPVVPAVLAGFGQLFSCQLNDGHSADNAIFWKTGGDRLSQLTANFTTKTSQFTGRSFLPGPGADVGTCGTVMVQWSFLTFDASSIPPIGATGTITFPRPFPNRCFGIFTNIYFKKGTAPTPVVSVGVEDTGDKTSFDYRVRGDTTDYTGFWWMAIGT